MGIFKKKKDEGEDVAAEEAPAPQLPPAPSATELALIGEREKSASAYKRASKAERSYRANKNAGRAREDFKSSKAHFKTALAEFKLGTKALSGAMKTSPALVQEKRAKADGSAETKRAKREEEKRKALAEKLKKAEEKAAAEAEAAA